MVWNCVHHAAESRPLKQKFAGAHGIATGPGEPGTFQVWQPHWAGRRPTIIASDYFILLYKCFVFHCSAQSSETCCVSFVSRYSCGRSTRYGCAPHYLSNATALPGNGLRKARALRPMCALLPACFDRMSPRLGAVDKATAPWWHSILDGYRRPRRQRARHPLNGQIIKVLHCRFQKLVLLGCCGIDCLFSKRQQDFENFGLGGRKPQDRKKHCFLPGGRSRH
jgi:hypothetical protein